MREPDPRIHDEFQGNQALRQVTLGKAHHRLPEGGRQ
jgi:hypothetical protein